MTERESVTALVVAAGAGERLAAAVPKGLRLLAGRPLFAHSLEAFDRALPITNHVLVVPAQHAAHASAAAGAFVSKPILVVEGGRRRQDSVRLGLEAAARALAQDGGSGVDRLIAVHDAARPFPDIALIDRTIAAARASGAAVPVIRVTDTVREIAEGGGSARRIDRDRLRLAQTPQIARLDWLREAYAKAEEQARPATDECAALQEAGFHVTFVEGAASNLKITTPEEWDFAESLLASRKGGSRTRVGFGEDRHRRTKGRPFVLAGVTLDERDGPEGHSDGDPLCHALVDALLGALGEGTIGDHFPDSDARWAGAGGLDLLEQTMKVVRRKGWRVVNADAVIIADAPRIAPHAAEIRARVAAVLGVETERVSVKGKRAEGLGFEGAGQGVACRAIALLEQAPDP